MSASQGFTAFILFVYLQAAADGQISQCKTPSGQPGICKSIYDCEALLLLVKNKNITEEDVQTLRKSHCGFRNGIPNVCCPGCTTPDGLPGDCISIFKCSHLSNLLRPPVSQANIDYVRNSKCKDVGQYGVCCGLPVKGNCSARQTAFPPDPQTECCGVDSIGGNKIIGGTATTVDQYPWLALIEYVKNNEGSIKLLCGAALISGKYVLTAGHCVAGAILDVGTPTNVRLGEYDTMNQGPDCIAVEAGGTDCTTGITTIAIEKTIPHPDYNPVSPSRRNDIALIRMAQMAPYTDFIRPICLPSVDLTLSPPSVFTLFAAGWGAVSTSQARSNVKLHVELPFVAAKDCLGAYAKRKVNLWEKQMCAGGVQGKDSCKGDSGGPLMYVNGRINEVIGVVSFGPLPCGLENVPGVYTKVYEYNDWIRSTIQA